MEALSRESNALAAAAGSGLRGWQTSAAYVWTEALDEAVNGTAGCVLSGALLTAAALLVCTGSLMLTLTTLLGVLSVLVCFIGYLSQRAYALGVIEAIATTIFIGFACDYCVHVAQVHRTTGRSLACTLRHAGPSLYGAALTTVSAAAPLLFCEVLLFRQMGEFICVCTALSLLVALSLIGPIVCIASDAPANEPPEVKATCTRGELANRSNTEFVPVIESGVADRSHCSDPPPDAESSPRASSSVSAVSSGASCAGVELIPAYGAR